MLFMLKRVLIAYQIYILIRRLLRMRQSNRAAS